MIQANTIRGITILKPSSVYVNYTVSYGSVIVLVVFQTDQRQLCGLWSSFARLYAVLTHRHRSVHLSTATQNNYTASNEQKSFNT